MPLALMCLGSDLFAHRHLVAWIDPASGDAHGCRCDQLRRGIHNRFRLVLRPYLSGAAVVLDSRRVNGATLSAYVEEVGNSLNSLRMQPCIRQLFGLFYFI